jgi:hypothetical protein
MGDTLGFGNHLIIYQDGHHNFALGFRVTSNVSRETVHIVDNFGFLFGCSGTTYPFPKANALTRNVALKWSKD